MKKKKLYTDINSKWKDFRLDEATKKYPSQDDAEAMNDWYNSMQNIYVGSSSQLVRKAFDKADKIRQDLHRKIFGDDSPWSLERKGNKIKVIWNKDKAKSLGIGE